VAGATGVDQPDCEVVDADIGILTVPRAEFNCLVNPLATAPIMTPIRSGG
jgi:hypothetical protein